MCGKCEVDVSFPSTVPEGKVPCASVRWTRLMFEKDSERFGGDLRDLTGNSDNTIVTYQRGLRSDDSDDSNY